MRRMLGFLFLAVVACGGSKVTQPPPPPKQMGTLYFVLSPATCSGAHITYFEVDSTEFGPETLAPGVVSKGYSVTAEIHPTRVRIADYVAPDGRVTSLWTLNQRITVPANGTATHTAIC